MTKSSAPGKIILFGEHAVVYGQPAIAVPVTQVQATACIEDAPRGSGCTIKAPDLEQTIRLAEALAAEPLAAAVRGTLEHLQSSEPDINISIQSTLPIAGGMGSGAAVSAAIIRVLAAHLGHKLDDASISKLVFEVEKLHHGTPSGIDNTVVVYAQAVYFIKGQPIETFNVAHPFHIAIGDTGLASPTRVTVGDVRAGWQADPSHYESLFRQIGIAVQMARRAIERGDLNALGALMDGNHALLQELNVSCPELDALVIAARRAGALGAKLSGGGRGGNMIALLTPETQTSVERALQKAGAKSVIITEVS